MKSCGNLFQYFKPSSLIPQSLTLEDIDALPKDGKDRDLIRGELAAHEPSSPYFEGAPILAVEILSPSDKQEEVDEKVELYLAWGVHVVWIVNPRLQTVTVLVRPNAFSGLYSGTHTLDAEPHLPEC
jgi:Uma2 family endonuclease